MIIACDSATMTDSRTLNSSVRCNRKNTAIYIASFVIYLCPMSEETAHDLATHFPGFYSKLYACIFRREASKECLYNFLRLG